MDEGGIMKSRKSRRYKRCPKCLAMLRPSAEFCPQCGTNMPIGFPHNPRVAAEAVKAIMQLNTAAPDTRPIPAQPQGEYLVVVARDRRDLYDYLSQKFSGEPGIRVVQERRTGDRRRSERTSPLERRRRDRRSRPLVDAELRRFGFAIVNLLD
jgi:hypothetical protein